MTFSGLTDQIKQSKQCSSRNGTVIDTFLVHHQAGTNDDWTINAMVSGSKEVSANYTISNEGRVTGVVPEEDRAWTSGSTTDGGKGAQWDRRSITVEIENMTGAPDWRISPAAFAAAVKLYKDLQNRYNIKFLYGHRDLYQLFKASYPTYCPGPETVDTIKELASGSALAEVPVKSTPVGAGSDSGPESVIDYHFGLTKAAMLAIQKALARAGRYKGDQDGDFGAQSVTAFQQWLKDYKYLDADYKVDGIPGTVYGTAVQTLAKKFGYTYKLDGLPRTATSAALEKWAATIHPAVPQVRAAASGPDWSYWEPTGELAKQVQRGLAGMGRYNYPNGSSRPIDGDFGENARKGVQLTLKVSGEFDGLIDGKILRGGCYGIQTYAARFGDYDGPIDGAPREASWAGFALGLKRK